MAQVYSGLRERENAPLNNALLLPKLRCGLYNAGSCGFGPPIGETETHRVIASWANPDGSVGGIRLTSNFSLDARGLALVLAALAGVTLLLAGLLALQGFWPVFAIAVVQVVLVSWLLVRTWENTWAVETIEIGPERIRIVSQRYRSRREIELETAWAVVETIEPEFRWYDPVVRLRSGTRAIELGRFLTADEKRRFADQLARAIERYSVLHARRDH